MKNDLPESLSKFEGQLERAIRRELERAPAPTRLGRARPRLLAGTTLGLVAIATALALALTAANSPPAYAVTRNHDGTVSVKVMRLDGVAGANASLARMNVHAKLVQVAAHCASQPPPANRRLLRWRASSARLKPWRIPAGRTLVIMVRKGSRRVNVAQGTTVAGAVPDCAALPLPPCLAGKGRHMDARARSSNTVIRRAARHRVWNSANQVPIQVCKAAGSATK